ncbi:hypothetical protein EV183_001783 [Coemansia sp. RSA 2336]|nr:hypothetical protein EV183_001783 [Coemansia sp. RSA 2336]
MLSGPTKAAGEADTDLKNWLPEFDHPRISLDLSALSPPDTAEVSESDEKPEPASNAFANTSGKSASPQTDAPQNEDFLEAVVYANLSEYASMVSKEDEDNADILSQAQAPHTDAAEGNSELLQPPPSPTPSSSHVDSADLENLANKLPEAPVDTNNGEADQLGVDFDFDTDPAIDAISTSPLFAVAGTSLGSASGQDKQEALETSQLGQPAQSGARKGRGRRASIAGMLMRRASKYVDAASPTLPANAAAAAASTNSSANMAQVLSESRKQESAEQAEASAAAAASEASKETDAAPASKITVASKELVEAPPADCDKSQAAASTSGGNLADDECGSKEQTDDTAHDTAAVAAKPSTDQASADMAKGTDNDASDEHIETVQTAGSGSSASMAKEALPLPPPSKPRSVEKRSSRILSGITRKVNHVRQTTSMVLRRSVGSRLSIAPGKSLDTVNGPAPKQSECSTSQDQKDTVRDEPPQYTSEEHVHAVAEAEISDAALSAVADTPAMNTAASADGAAVNSASDSQAKVDSETKSNAEASVSGTDNAASTHESAPESNDNTSVATSSDSSSNASDNVDEVEDTSNRAATEGAKAHANSEATDEDGLDAKTTFTKRFGMVRRGTNEAVRNSVSRMKHIFASKRPVVA